MWYELFINGEDLPAGSVNRQNPATLDDFLLEYPDLGKISSHEIREWRSGRIVEVVLNEISTRNETIAGQVCIVTTRL